MVLSIALAHRRAIFILRITKVSDNAIWGLDDLSIEGKCREQIFIVNHIKNRREYLRLSAKKLGKRLQKKNEK